jgi:hypothetical protein
MRRAPFLLLLSFSSLVLAGSVTAQSLDGRWVGEDEPTLTLTLRESPGGGITGTLIESGMSMPFSATPAGKGFAGTLGSGYEAVAFTVTLQGDRVIMEFAGLDADERLTFRRAAAAPPDAADTGGRSVVINGKRMSDQELAHAEQTYNIHIPDADYWYDPVLGAWGVQGSPTLGLIAPGLAIGGALRADASGGGTNVFVNGRELHPYDVKVLQQIAGAIQPGRYFITADGLAGFEGGPPLWNLATLAAQPGGGGGSTNWRSRITGASGFSDGTTGAVFLPNGGIVSTGN